MRMLKSIHTVLETIFEALPLFTQACILVSFLLMAYSLVGMSLWGGGLLYECWSPYTAGGLPRENATHPESHQCPACLKCGTDALSLAKGCVRVEPPLYIRSESYGF